MLKSKVGYSTNSDAYQSGSETASKAMEGLTSPKIGMFYASCVYGEEAVQGAKSILGDIPMIGCTSSGAIIVPDGIIQSETGFSGMMVMDDEDMTVSVAGSERGEDPRETGRRIALEAIKNSGLRIRPSYFYMVASPKEEEFYLKGIEDVIGRVPLFGGSAADDAVAGKWRIFCNDKVFQDGCAVAFFYTNKEIVTEYTGAYRETEDMGIITKVDDNRTLVEIDHTPSLQKYATWRGLDVSNLRGMDLLSATILSPLAVKDPLGDVVAIRHPMIGNDDDTMNIGNNLEVGTAVIRMETTVEELICSTSNAIERLKEKLEEPTGAYFLVHCGGRKLGIGNRIEEVYEKIKEATMGTPFLVIFTFGEYGYQNHSANTCGGLMLSFTAFEQ